MQKLGVVFPEGIILGRGRRRLSPDHLERNSKSSSGRMIIFVLLLIIGLGIILVRFFSIELIEGSRYKKLSEGNRIREVKIAAPRGIIYDRSNKALVRNIPVFTLSSGERFFEEKPASLSGNIAESVARDYPYGGTVAHAVGYTGEIEEEELKETNNQLGDIVGKTGIERSYDTVLRGKDGKELIEVDALSNIVRTLGRIEPTVGSNITLTLDINLQEIARETLGDRKGAVVVENPASGEVLALYSSPSFDPNNLIRARNVAEIFTDSRQPLFDRAISGEYPPGSTFKILTALSALESGKITPNTQIEDTGVLTVGKFSFGNWYFSQYGKKEGMLNIVGAIRRSNDIFFYKVGEEVGIEKLAEWVKSVGMGKPTGIDIGGEAGGLMPDPKWQKETKGEDWYLGNTYHVAIGQGDILATPLQVNAWTNIIANSGRLCKPHLVNDLSNLSHLSNLPARSAFSTADAGGCKDLGIKKESIVLVREGMKEACDTGGTGWPLFKFKAQSANIKADDIDFFEAKETTPSGKTWVEIPVACKTGTAEFGSTAGSGQVRTHAWFTAFAPVNKPQISVTVLIEGGGEGSSVAAPIAKKIFEEWFSR